MKTLFKIFFLCAGSMAFAQSVQDYPFVTVPGKTKDFADNKYGLQALLAKQMAKKNYAVLSGDKMAWPGEAQNPCSVLTANIINSSSMLRNKVTVDFRDCNDKSVAKFEGMSLEKDFETGYPDALNKAAAKIPNSSGKMSVAPSNTQVAASQMREEPKREEPAKVQPTKAEPAPVTSTSAKAEVYSNGSLNLNRIVIAPGQFILANPNTSVPYAVFKESGRQGVYHVKLQNGLPALGYFDNGNLIIETSQSDGALEKEKLEKK